MNEIIRIEIPVEAETARALADQRRRVAVGRLIDRMVRPKAADDPLAMVLELTSRRSPGNRPDRPGDRRGAGSLQRRATGLSGGLPTSCRQERMNLAHSLAPRTVWL